MWKALAAITTLAFTLVTPIAGLTQDVPAGQKSVPEQVVDSFNTVFGVHPGARATHAKGVVLEGTFTPSASATSVSKAPHLPKKKTPVPVTIRFSDSTGLPAIPDTDPGASPRGMAVKFHLPSGSITDIVVHSFNGFPVATAAELRDFFLALAATKPGDPQPTALDSFLTTHAAAKAFVEAPKPAPVSYATLPYFGVNAFKFTNAKGTATFSRYQLRPIGGEEFLTKDQLSTMGPDYLTTEIRERVRRGPIKFKLLVQMAERDDKVDDPTIVWPDSRKKVELGTITITKAVADSQTAEKKLLFMPGVLLPGIEAADPMIAARSAAYIVSLSRRAQAQ
ncbi:MAG: catalase family peroxidase [Nitrospirota bacterium]|nr:catalase family peroxidase [Nitrospirota bacterium]